MSVAFGAAHAVSATVGVPVLRPRVEGGPHGLTATGERVALEVTAFLADSADTVNGKIYALGIGWDLLVGPAFPFAFPRVALGILVHVEWTETDAEHEIRVHLETEDGVVVPLTTAGGNGPDSAPMTHWATGF